MAGKAKSIHIRIGRNDYDLLLLSTQYKMSSLVKTAIRNYLTGSREELIPLPTYMQMNQGYKNVNVRLDDEEDADIITFIDQIPSGNKCHVYKALLRYSMEHPDVRQWLNDPEAAKKPKAAPKAKKTRPQMTESVNDAPVSKTKAPKIVTTTKPAGSEDEDIFDLI